jgi:hypothetical protein
MSLPPGQPRFWVESRRTAHNTSSVWYRADTIEEARELKESFTETGNECVIIHEWVGLRYAPVEGAEEGIELMAAPFWDP